MGKLKEVDFAGDFPKMISVSRHYRGKSVFLSTGMSPPDSVLGPMEASRVLG
jgi:hypothetical protein